MPRICLYCCTDDCPYKDDGILRCLDYSPDVDRIESSIQVLKEGAVSVLTIASLGALLPRPAA